MPRKTPADLLFILAIDHRVDFPKDLLGVDEGAPSAAQLARAAHPKGIVFAGRAEAAEAGPFENDGGERGEKSRGKPHRCGGSGVGAGEGERAPSA